MNREQAKDIVKGYLGSYLNGKGINTRKLFTCLNPAHPDKHPSMGYDEKQQRCHCFACNATYDIFDLIGIDYGITDPGEIFKKAYELYNIDLDSPQLSTKEKNTNAPASGKGSETEPTACRLPEGTIEDIKTAAAAFKESPAEQYINNRGISTETATRYCLGYLKGGLLIPTGKENYVLRNISEKCAKGDRYRNTGPSLIFNRIALERAKKPVYVVEGEIDALSVIEAGGEAVGLGSTANKNALLQMVTEKTPAQPLILSLDKDEAGQKAEEDLAEALTAAQISFYRHDISGQAKDANEALLADREAFRQRIMEGEEKPAKEIAELLKAEKEAYMQTCAAVDLDDFTKWVQESANTPVISTGFASLDKILDGGLYAGLYVLGAISSLGKTTLALQIADQIAQQGQDVLIFSLEMAKNELIAKSISRTTYMQSGLCAKTVRDIITGARYEKYSKKDIEVINSAQQAYKEYAGHIFIHEGIGDIGVEKIREEVQKHVTYTGRTPVVFIDYIQIIAPYDVRSTDKQNTDKAVLELKRLSRDYKTPVLGISSFNRESYKTGNKNRGTVTAADFKESGAIEYSADVLIGLEFAIARSRDEEERKSYDESKEKGKYPRSVRLMVLKNRNGEAYKNIVFDYYAAYNTYQVSKADKWNVTEDGSGSGTESPAAAAVQDPFAALREKPAK